MTEHRPCAVNDEYMLFRAVSGASPKPVILDFGCGQGGLVALGRARGLDIYGVDTFTGNYETWSRTLPTKLAGRIRVIKDGRIPFDDRTFDVVVSNQVFEHMPAPRAALMEIARVLKPGGKFIAIFPHAGVWFEGHVGLYFAHSLARWPRLQHAYLRWCHRLGFGYYRDVAGVAGWEHILKDVVFYHRRHDIEAWWSEVFGRPPESLSHDWMVFRIAASPRLRRFAPLARSRFLAVPLAQICHRRAGLVLGTINPARS